MVDGAEYRPVNYCIHDSFALLAAAASKTRKMGLTECIILCRSYVTYIQVFTLPTKDESHCCDGGAPGLASRIE